MNDEQNVNTNTTGTTMPEETPMMEEVETTTVEMQAQAAADEPAAEAEPDLDRPASFDDLRVSMALQGTIKRIELYGAFVDIGIGTDGLLHISQLGQANVRNVEDVVKAGETLTVYVLKVDKDARRIALSLERPPAVGWDNLEEGMTITGKVTRIEGYGAFVDIGAEREGMIHVSELASGYVNSPSDVVQIGQMITAQVIKLNRKKRRIDLSIKALEEVGRRVERAERAAVEAANREEDALMPTEMELALRKAMEANGDSFPEVDRTGERTERRSPKGRNDRKGNNRRRNRDDEMEDIFERTLRSNKN